jgi:serine/threonine protein kinase
MAPEQVMRTHVADPRTDIYAIGAIAYFLLTGRPPFLGDDAMAIMVAHARDAVVPPSQVHGDLPGDLENVVLRCLEKNPNDRYQDAESLGRALAACADAKGWSPLLAEAWWRQHEPCFLLPDAQSPPAVDAVGAPSSATDLTRAQSDAATFGASEIEPASDTASAEGIELSLTQGDYKPRASRDG